MVDFFPCFEERRIATSGAEINLATGGSGPPLREEAPDDTYQALRAFFT